MELVARTVKAQHNLPRLAVMRAALGFGHRPRRRGTRRYMRREKLFVRVAWCLGPGKPVLGQGIEMGWVHCVHAVASLRCPFKSLLRCRKDVRGFPSFFGVAMEDVNVLSSSNNFPPIHRTPGVLGSACLLMVIRARRKEMERAVWALLQAASGFPPGARG